MILPLTHGGKPDDHNVGQILMEPVTHAYPESRVKCLYILVFVLRERVAVA